MSTPQDRDPRQNHWELAKALTEKCGPVAFKYTVPIFRETELKGRMKAYHFGSGVLARVEGKPFLLTAGHVLDVVVGSPDVFGLSTGKPGTKGVRLLYEVHGTNLPPGTVRPDTDFVDVGAFRLRRELADALADRFAPESVLEPNENEAVGNQYLLIGFPGSSKRRKFYNRTATAKAFTYATSLYRLDRGTPPGHDPSVEILVNYSERNNRSATFQQVTASDPHGMSGCGIWRMYSPEPPSETWDVGEMRLVGLTHTHCKKLGIVRGTRIDIFLEMIRQGLL